jgi:hypothetical protein
LELNNEQDYIKCVLHPLAETYVERGKYAEAVYNYELSGVRKKVKNDFKILY